MKMKLMTLTVAMATMVPTLLFEISPASAAEQPAQPCQAQPPQKHRESPSGRTGDGLADKSRLQDCNGVLHPPAVGDPEIVKPAPDVGKMPVIPPASVPKDGSGGRGQTQ